MRATYKFQPRLTIYVFVVIVFVFIAASQHLSTLKCTTTKAHIMFVFLGVVIRIY